MKLSSEQQKIVEENLGLVGKVIKDTVCNIKGIQGMTYEDLFQIGSIGLCKAVYTDKSKEGFQNTQFSTYAYMLIRNEIYTALERTTKKTGREQVWNPEELPVNTSKPESDRELALDLNDAINQAMKTAKGITALGIKALRLHIQGYSYKEIAEDLGLPANHVRAYVSKARKYLKEYPDIRALRAYA